jgi:hypothetical protein
MVEIAVSNRDWPKLLLRLRQIGLEPGIGQYHNEKRLVIDSGIDLTDTLDGLEAVILPPVPPGFRKLSDL